MRSFKLISNAEKKIAKSLLIAKVVSMPSLHPQSPAFGLKSVHHLSSYHFSWVDTSSIFIKREMP